MSLAAELGTVVTTTRALFGAGACSCGLVDASGDVVEFVAAAGRGAEAILGTTLPVSRGLAGWVVLSGQPIAATDVTEDARFARDVAEATDYVPAAILAAPIVDANGESVGVIEVLDPHRGASETRLGELTSTAAELAVLACIAQGASAIVRLADRGGDAPDGLRQLVSDLGGARDTATLAQDVLRAVNAFVEGRR